MLIKQWRYDRDDGPYIVSLCGSSPLRLITDLLVMYVHDPSLFILMNRILIEQNSKKVGHVWPIKLFWPHYKITITDGIIAK